MPNKEHAEIGRCPHGYRVLEDCLDCHAIFMKYKKLAEAEGIHMISAGMGDERTVASFPPDSEQVYAFADLVALYLKGYRPDSLAQELLEKYKVWHPERPIQEYEQIEQQQAEDRKEIERLRAAILEVDFTLCRCRYSDRIIEGCNCDIHEAHQILDEALSPKPGSETD